MRVLVDYTTNDIIQVEKTPPIGEAVVVNGKYVFPVPPGVNLKVNPNSIVLPSSDPGSVVAQSFAGLLAQFPQYENILFNPLIEDTDIDDLDPTGVLNEGAPVTDTFISRFQTGRGTGGPLASGQAANTTALLRANTTVIPNKPGVIVTDTIDIAPLTGGEGANDFAVFWYLYDFETTQDVRSGSGLFAGQNNASLRRIIEIEQEAPDFQAFISVNDGANFVEVDLLVPVTFCDPGTLVKLAFKNTNPDAKKYIASYAVLF